MTDQIQIDLLSVASELPVPATPGVVSLEIERDGSAWFLYRYDSNGQCLGDTWHPSAKEAIKQSEFEFGVVPDDWPQSDFGSS